MKPASDIATTPVMETPGKDRFWETKLPANWQEALLALIASRLALIALEFKEAAHAGARRLLLVLMALVCACFMWMLLLAGVIAGIAHATGWPWYWLAIGVGILHLVAAMGLARAAKSPAAPAFPVTRAEFKKDREWIENLKKTRKSNV